MREESDHQPGRTLLFVVEGAMPGSKSSKAKRPLKIGARVPKDMLPPKVSTKKRTAGIKSQPRRNKRKVAVP
jgi:hypothetical protein